MKIDLHAHSNCSDGKESVEEVFRQAKLAGVDVLALTDHDTTHGWPLAAAAASAEGIGFVPGIEVTTRAHVYSPSGELHKFGVHMLAYLPDPNHEELQQVLSESVTSREVRLRAIVEKIGADYDLDWSDVEMFLADGATFGRPAVADAMVHRGHFNNRDAVFAEVWPNGVDRYYVPNRGVPDTVESIRLIRRAGGVPIIAHPLSRGKGPEVGQVMPRQHFEEMIAAGLAGFEVDHRDVPPHAQKWLREMAAEFDLIVTGSSDYHGLTGKKNRLGENTTSPEMLERVVAQSTGTIAQLN
jgi:predicted metal-dependent phosphoesterase TrpH